MPLDAAYEARARELGLDIAPGAFVYALPCIAGHVGADTAGVVLAEGPHLKDELTLLVDVGTNAEIVFGNRERLFACSSPTGPAFEGAQISCGQRAAPGAIERVRIDRATLEPQVQGDRLRSVVRRAGLRRGDRDARRHRRLRFGDHRGDRRDVSGRDRLGRRRDRRRTRRAERRASKPVGRTFAYVLHEGAPRLLIYQTDVRAIQLAKAALYAGAKLLMERAGRRA